MMFGYSRKIIVEVGGRRYSLRVKDPPEKRFIRRKENFTCGNCNAHNNGNGYTNHCRKCLWSRHVDINPGNRMSTCRGMMRPIAVDFKNSNYILIHRCTRCGEEKRNTVSPEDSREEIMRLAHRLPNGNGNNGKKKKTLELKPIGDLHL